MSLTYCTSHKKSVRYSLLLPLLICVLATMWQAQYAIVPLEWGLMLGNAKDLIHGLKPYKDIFIQYGFLTTLIHAAAYSFGGNMLSLMLVTALAYAVGIFGIFQVARLTGMKERPAIYITWIYLLFHPIVIYPWSNYIAFPLLLFGLKYHLKVLETRKNAALSGVFFGLAVLAREGLTPAVLLFIFAGYFLNYLKDRNFRVNSQFFLICALGFITPILIFIIYLYSNNLLLFWQKLSWSVPQVYAEVMFPHMKVFSVTQPWKIVTIFYPLFDQIYFATLSGEPRWIFFLLILILNTMILFRGLFNTTYLRTHLASVKVSLLSILLLSSALHLPEVFRIATGSAIGMINIYYFIKTDKYRILTAIASAIVFISSIIPSTSGYKFSSTNYFFPSSDQRMNAVSISIPSDLNGQKWSAEIANFYFNFTEDLKKIEKYCPNIRYHHNNTHDGFLHVLSPFKKYQFAPFWFFPEMNSLRPDYTLRDKINSDGDIVLFRASIITGQQQKLLVPTNYHLWKTYSSVLRAPHDGAVQILLPNGCLD